MTTRTPYLNADPIARDRMRDEAWEAGELDAKAGNPPNTEGQHPDLAAVYTEAYEMVAGPAAPEPYALGALTPGQHRAAAIADDAEHVLGHLNAVGVTFDARKKVSEAEEFSFLCGASTLHVPTKLAGVTAFQDRIERAAEILDALGPAVAGVRFYPTFLHVGDDGAGRPVVVVMVEMTPGDRTTLRALGTLQDKHAAWLAPLIETNERGAVTHDSTPVRVAVTAVTGGTPDRPTRGVNVAIGGAAQVIRRRIDAAADEAAAEAAYGSGSRAAVEAATA